jgi:hypothetical protein
MNTEFFTALELLEREKGIPQAYMIEKIEAALVSAFKKEYGNNTNVRVHIDPAKKDVRVYQQKEVVEVVEDPATQISLADAKAMSRRNVLGSTVEFEVKTTPAKWIEIGAMVSIGDWKWDSDNVRGYAYNIYGQALSENGEVTTPGAPDHAYATINMKDIHIGGSAQTSAAINVTMNVFRGFRIGGGYYYYDRNYAYYSLSGSSLSIGKELYVTEPWEIPSYGCVDLWGSYKFKLGAATASVSAQVSNLLDNYYIEKAWNPSTVSNSSNDVNYEDVYFFYSLGRTWSVKLKLDI